jgi:hypothetical protein
MLNWPKRCRKEKWYFERRIWESRCGRYRVVHSHCPYGTEMADRWYAMVYDFADAMWDRLSTHRKREPAFKACESHAGKGN